MLLQWGPGGHFPCSTCPCWWHLVQFQTFSSVPAPYLAQLDSVREAAFRLLSLLLRNQTALSISEVAVPFFRAFFFVFFPLFLFLFPISPAGLDYNVRPHWLQLRIRCDWRNGIAARDGDDTRMALGLIKQLLTLFSLWGGRRVSQRQVSTRSTRRDTSPGKPSVMNWPCHSARQPQLRQGLLSIHLSAAKGPKT